MKTKTKPKDAIQARAVKPKKVEPLKKEVLEAIPRSNGGRFGKGYNPHALGICNRKPDNKMGRKRILELFDRIVAEDGHMSALEVEIRKVIDQKGMLYFFQQYVQPLIPKDLSLKVMSTFMSGDNPLDAKTPEQKQARDGRLREIFGIPLVAETALAPEEGVEE